MPILHEIHEMLISGKISKEEYIELVAQYNHLTWMGTKQSQFEQNK